jgi:mitochondrial fission protein ELM1
MLADLADKSHGSLMVTPSRRTGAAPARIIRDALKDKPFVMWDGIGSNPYFGYLGSADAVIVTCDSVNMISEAAAIGKPVHVIELEGGSTRTRHFLHGIYAQGAARPFAGHLESWPCAPLNATWEIADAIARAMHARHRQASRI